MRDTRDDGTDELAVPQVFDRNGNGRLDPEEGSIVVLGGIDTSTGLPLQVVLTAPAGATVVTPLATLATVLMQQDHLTLDDAVARITTAFGLRGVGLLGLDPIAATIGEDPAAPAVLAANAKVQNTVVQIAHLIQGSAASSVELKKM